MNREKRVAQVPSNADGNTSETHDDDSALRSDWGSDVSDGESFGDGRPRDDPEEHHDEPPAQDDQVPNLFPESGARAPDFPRVGGDVLSCHGGYFCFSPTLLPTRRELKLNCSRSHPVVCLREIIF